MNIVMNVLDHGYVKLIESWGSDERIIEAARMSTDKGFLGWGPFPCSECLGTGRVSLYEGDVNCSKCKGTGSVQGDEKLLAYLYEHNHATPFEMAGMVIEVQAPIFVFREWHRHRTQSYNELSARYTPIPDVNYVPTPERCLLVSGTNKQAQGVGRELTHQHALTWLSGLADVYAHAQEVYELGLSLGVPKELARLPVPVGRYSRMRASGNLRNWLAFLTLRSDKNPDAQWEIRQFANEVATLVEQCFPRTYTLFCSGGRL